MIADVKVSYEKRISDVISELETLKQTHGDVRLYPPTLEFKCKDVTRKQPDGLVGYFKFVYATNDPR